MNARYSLNRMMARSRRDWKRTAGGKELVEVVGDIPDVILADVDVSVTRRTRATHVSRSEVTRERIEAQAHSTRIEIIYAGMERALRNDQPGSSLRAWLQLCVLWGFAPTGTELVAK